MSKVSKHAAYNIAGLDPNMSKESKEIKDV